MAYILKQFDKPLMSFEMERDIDGVIVRDLELTEGASGLLPLDMECSEQGVAKWLKRRTIPSNRAYVQNFLSKLGLNEKDTKGIMDFCKGLSLNDCYWVVDERFDGKFADHNLFDNRFSNTLSLIAFTGYGSNVRSALRSSPEFTTGGMLAKCWRRVDGKILLFKSGTEGFANSGNEPYCEYYAAQVAECMNIDAVKYNLSKWKGRLCSTCEIFTNKNLSYISAGSLVKGNIDDVAKYYRELGDEYYQSELWVVDRPRQQPHMRTCASVRSRAFVAHIRNGRRPFVVGELCGYSYACGICGFFAIRRRSRRSGAKRKAASLVQFRIQKTCALQLVGQQAQSRQNLYCASSRKTP